jgi:hypothetical protein
MGARNTAGRGVVVVFSPVREKTEITGRADMMKFLVSAFLRCGPVDLCLTVDVADRGSKSKM